MALTIGEANAAAVLLRAVTGEGRDIDPDQLAAAMRELDAKAGKALQLRVISSHAVIDTAAADLAQRHADAGGG